ncbi:hypothetical protein [Ktedonobacter racemifer]|uniref:Uncharacterized protein n=1 Tax=Ktedonobacter racemifer DSM 44963 TaxID=485913 RepID=D6TCR0_KTERA|nr:hypothetical protein [Ktedonobacter racemifer]EFH88174.1 hypothetical protein Krac_9582 [Ktedonobacter racemifer DSM 44963]
MSSPSATQLIRLGLLTIPLTGVLKLVGNLGTFNSVGYGIPDQQAAQTITGSGFFIGEFVGSILPTVLFIFGSFALFVYLFNTTARRWATIGMVLSVVGSALVLPPLGVVNYAFPALGHAYLAGDRGAIGLVNNFFRFPLLTVFFPVLLQPVGTILFSIGIWRSEALSRFSAVLFAVAGLLIAIPVPIHLIRWTGGVVMIIAGAWMVWSFLRQPEPYPRVKAQGEEAIRGSMRSANPV